MKALKFNLSSTRIFQVLLASSFLITVLSLISHFIRLYFKTDLWETIWLIEVSGDNNIPTWYASVTLLFCALLLFVIGWIRRQECDRYAKHWLGLSTIFLLLSVDEVAKIHERAGSFVNTTQSADSFSSGFLYYSWVIIAFPLLVLFALLYIRFLRALPTRTRQLFLLAATFYVGGALGLEMINSKLDTVYGYDSWPYTLVTACEELSEMLGVAIFTYALLSYLDKRVDLDFIKIVITNR